MHPQARYWIVDVPAKIVDLVGFSYALGVAAGSLVCLTTVGVVLVLYAFGIRWGW